MQLTRSGFTIAELLAAIAVGGIATALMTATIVRQQRFYSGAAKVVDVRSQLRDAADILATDIRSADVAAFGLPVMSDTAIEMVTTIGSSVACTLSAPYVIGLPPGKLAIGNTLTSFLVPPDTGDVALIYTTPSGAPDSATWDEYDISSFGMRTLSAACPPLSGFTTAGDASASAGGYSLQVVQPLSSAVRPGALIHFVRRARYSFYRSSDGEWYLGYRRCGFGGSGCAAIQPVTGPFRPLRTGQGSGIGFRYYDSSGSALTSTSQSRLVARVEIVIRGKSADIALTGDARRSWQDSIAIMVSPRNRLR